MKRILDLLSKETSYQIDLPTCDGGTRSAGNIARDCFHYKRDFLMWTTSTLAPEHIEDLLTIHTNLGALVLMTIFEQFPQDQHYPFS